MTKTVQYGYVESGKLHLLNEARFKDDLRQFKDCDVQVTVKKKGRRSSQQNRFYWGVVVEEIRLNLLDRGNRFDADTVHEYLKQKFNYESIVITQTGEMLQVGQSTTELNKEEFGVYLDRIIEWAAQSLELTIPLPNTQLQMFSNA